MRSSVDFGTLVSMSHRLYGSPWHGIALGLLSTFAGLAVAELMTGLVKGASSPVLPVGQEIIDVVPPGVKDWAIETFGTADKAVLILGTVISLAVIGSIVGILAVRGATKHDILAAFEARIGNSPEQELVTALEQVCRIVRFRLEDRVVG